MTYEHNIHQARDIFHRHCRAMDDAISAGELFAEPAFHLRRLIQQDIPDISGTLEQIGTVSLSEVIVQYANLSLAIIDNVLLEDY